MKAYVKIQSSTTINVTAGLQCKNVTNPDAHVPDRLKVNPSWPKCTVLIREGVHWYPSEITEWPTVKALANDKILTIGEDSDKPVDNPEMSKEQFDRNKAKLDKTPSLDEVAGKTEDNKEEKKS